MPAAGPPQAWQNPEVVSTWIAVAMGIVIGLGLLLIWLSRLYIKRTLLAKETAHLMAMKQQKELLHATVTAQERERARIAADLHDELMSKLNVLSLLSHSNEQGINTSEIISESIATARRISHDLAPPMIEKTSLRDLISEQIELIKSQYTIKLYFNTWHESPTNKRLKIQTLRMVQEAFNNILKHAEATAIDIHCRFSNRYLSIKIADNGRGVPPKQHARGLGLSNIASRIQLLQGQYRLKNSSNGGTCLLLHIPLNQQTNPYEEDTLDAGR